MKQQVTRLSPHQNGKIFAVLMAVTSLVFVVPAVLVSNTLGDKENALPMYMVLLLLMTAVACIVYNFAAKFVGGIEFEAQAKPE
jgi:hypothetical protein